MSVTVPLRFSPTQEAGLVEVAGSYNNWTKVAMTKNPEASGEWSISVNLTPGTHQYKYIVDGEWVVDSECATVDNNLGGLNNLIIVADFAKEMKCTAGHILENSTRETLWICNGCHCATNYSSDMIFRGTESASRNLYWVPSDAKRYRCHTCDYDLCEDCYISNGKKNHADCSLRAQGIPLKQILLALERAPEDGIGDWRCKRCTRRCLETPIFWFCEGCRDCRMCNECYEAGQKLE